MAHPPDDAPWELALERALMEQMDAARRGGRDSDDSDDEEADESESESESDVASSNRAEQVDELVALAAIFGDAMGGPAADHFAAALEEGGEVTPPPPTGALRFHLDVALADAAADDDEPPERRVVVLDEREGFVEDPLDAATFSIAHLPPVRLSVIFPSRYPSSSPPHFALSATWLPRASLEALASRLEEVWSARAREPVVFAWVDALRSPAARDALFAPEDGTLRLERRAGWRTRGLLSSEPSASATKTNVIPPGNRTSRRESESAGILPRGVPIARDPREALMSLLRHDAVERERREGDAERSCGICFSDGFRARDLVRVAGPRDEERQTRRGGSETSDRSDRCDHAYCRECVAAMAELHVREGEIHKLACPSPGCAAPFAPATLRSVVSRAAFERWERLALDRALDAMRDLSYCPRCETPTIEDAEHLGRCPHCAFAFCALCREGWHPGETCLSPEARLAVLRSREAGGGGGGSSAADAARRKHREAVADAMAARYVDREGARCPSCGAGVVKSEGCNKMTCGMCAAKFCYACGEDIGSVGYDHFRDGSRCSLFDRSAIAAWEREMAANANLFAREERHRDAYVRGLAAAETRCPGCAQANFKLGGNNHLRCWSCARHFCYACRKFVRRGAETKAHYGQGAGKCRQHSEG